MWGLVLQQLHPATDGFTWTGWLTCQNLWSLQKAWGSSTLWDEIWTQKQTWERFVCFCISFLSVLCFSEEVWFGSYLILCEIYQNTVYMENCNKSVTRSALLIYCLILSSWNPLKMQFTCKFDYHNVEHVWPIGHSCTRFDALAVLFLKSILHIWLCVTEAYWY